MILFTLWSLFRVDSTKMLQIYSVLVSEVIQTVGEEAAQAVWLSRILSRSQVAWFLFEASHQATLDERVSTLESIARRRRLSLNVGRRGLLVDEERSINGRVTGT